MIEIVWIDKRDFILEFKHFPDDSVDEMSQYIKDGITDPLTYIVKIKKWKGKVQSSGK